MSGKPFMADDFDKHIGQVISIQRQKMGMSQKALARAIGVTFQQIQKYETAQNRLSAGALCRITTAFEMTVGQLIDGAQQPYLNDKTVLEIIKLIQTKMNQHQRQLLLQISRQFVGLA